MRLVFFEDYRLGLVDGDAVVDVTTALSEGDGPTGNALAGLSPQERLLVLIGTFAELRPRIEVARAIGARRPLRGLRLRAPVPRPMKIVCAARNYHEGADGGVVPIECFLKSPEAILDPGGTVELPPAEATIFHHEAEVAVVIGRTARRVTAAEALDHVFAYTTFCDVSARGLMPRSFFSGKSFDTFAPIGPALVTVDEVPDPQQLPIALDVSGEPRQRFTTADMANSVAELIAWVSNVTTLRPGDVVATGTNHQGLGALQDGDRVHLRVADWPALEFAVRDPLGRQWPRGVDAETAARARGAT